MPLACLALDLDFDLDLDLEAIAPGGGFTPVARTRSLWAIARPISRARSPYVKPPPGARFMCGDDELLP
jgi:hypothetical protein